MEVTRKNFDDSFKEISEAIDESSFLAIDGEFTGLNHSGFNHSAPFDTPEERYYKVLEGSSDFLLVQFGLCAFSYNGNTKQYTAKPFNCYIFPRPFSRSAPDCRFSCQSSSLDFLISQGFDFNKAFREGVSYLTPSQEQKLRETVQKRHEQFSAFSSPAFTTPNGAGGSEPQVTKGPVQIPKEHKEFIDLICKQVEKFLEKNEEESMSLDPCTGFQRKLIYQTLNSKYSKEVYLQTKTGEKKERYIVVSRCLGEDDMKKKEEDKQAQDMAEIDNAVGFTKVIQKISQSGKLVIGHNMFLDLIHTIHQFMFPLSEVYEEFKNMVRCVFPRLLDTKLMASTQPFKEKIINSGLDALHKITQEEPFTKPDVVFAEGFDDKYSTTESLHEAGYDAYITGCCFISLTNFLGQFQKPPSDRVLPTSVLLEPFINKLHMMRSVDIPYLDLAAPDLNPPRDHVFYVAFPKEWTNTDLFHLFSPYGNVQVSWLDETSALVALNDKKHDPGLVLRALNKLGAVHRVMAYADYKNPSPNSKQTLKLDHRQGKLPSHPNPNVKPSSGPKQLSYAAAVKRHATSDEPEHTSKKQKTLNVKAKPFQSRITPNTTPEKTEGMKWPASSEKTSEESAMKKGSSETKMFAEPDW